MTAYVLKAGVWSASKRRPSRRRAALLLSLALALGVLGGCARKLQLQALPEAKGGTVDVRVDLTYNRNDRIRLEMKVPEPAAYGAPYNRYVAWVAPPDRSQVFNVGQIRVEGGKGKLDTLTPLRKFWLFLTVEEQGDVLKPGSLVVFKSPALIEW